MPPPWNEVNDREASDALHALAVAPARERHKWQCVACDSSDALHAYPGPRGGSYCWSCQNYFSNADAAAAWLGIPADEACIELAARFGIITDKPKHTRRTPSPRSRTARPPVRTDRDSNLAALTALSDPRHPPTVYAHLLETLPWEEKARQWAATRALDSDAMQAYGFRSLYSPSAWTAMRAALALFRSEEQTAAGFPSEHGRILLPWGGRAPMILIPYWHQGHTIGIRFRTDSDNPDVLRYLTLRDAQPAWPFAADALNRANVHIVEGELNAYTLQSAYGITAVGLGSAGIWQSEWTANLAHATSITAWYDDDPAGDNGAAKLHQHLSDTFGASWTRRRWRRLRTHADANDLHRTGPEAVARALAHTKTSNQHP